MQYRPVWREPLRAQWQGYEVLSAPPPSSGGFAIIQLLKMMDALAPDFAGLAHNSPQYIHLVAEMEKRVFADRAEYLGDPAFVDVPVARLMDDAYIASRAAEVNRDGRSRRWLRCKPGLESHDTIHFSIVDRDGNAVANTYTLNTDFGSGVVVRGAGFLLNNEMDDFSIKPGVPNFYGVVGSTANEVQAGKRMLSSMSPTILLQRGQRQHGAGVAGRLDDHQLRVRDHREHPALRAHTGAGRCRAAVPSPAAAAGTGHVQPRLAAAGRDAEALRARGYDPQPHPWEMGDVQVIWRSGDSYVPASDPRGRGESRVIH